MAAYTIQQIRDQAPVGVLDGSELFEVEHGGVSKAATLAEIAGYSTGAGNPILTTAAYGISPSSNPTTNVNNLQAFIDYAYANNLIGQIGAGTWEMNSMLYLRNGSRIIGCGMGITILEGVSGWSGANRIFYMDDGTNGDQINDKGLILGDMTCIGADKSASRDGSTIHLQALENFEIYRIHAQYGSDACIRVAGYGVGDFTNDITDPFWNASYRGHLHDCITDNGYLGIEVEGGLENYLIEKNTVRGASQHGIRLPSLYNGWVNKNDVSGCGTGLYHARCRKTWVTDNVFSNNDRGISIAGFYASDPETTTNLIVRGNDIRAAAGGWGISDSYLGGSDRWSNGVIIDGNIFADGAGISLRHTRNAMVVHNISLDDSNDIMCDVDATGLVANNLMRFTNSASGVVNGGNNLTPSL